MAGFGRSMLGWWSDADFGLGGAGFAGPDAPENPDAFILPPPPPLGSAADAAPDPVAPAPDLQSLFERIDFPPARIWYDVDGDGAVDKIPYLADAAYLPPNFDLI
ncbi:MAG: hypothetical protein NW206_20495 [Hyphomonadaceae bacterium]|nr:hypothetical protein [Hyphomonadaceae bacterium]